MSSVTYNTEKNMSSMTNYTDKICQCDKTIHQDMPIVTNYNMSSMRDMCQGWHWDSDKYVGAEKIADE